MLAHTVLKVCLTFDVDLVDYVADWRTMNEFESAIPQIIAILQQHSNMHTTWFIRLDSQIQSIWGKADYFFLRYGLLLSWLRENGHEIAWHPHCYVQAEGRWEQNVDVSSILDELTKYALVAQSYGLRSVRMGWGFHTNETMRLLADLGFAVDSSAIPRPRYQWEETEKDWTLTPVVPYFPSKSDYRVPGQPRLPILEVPMSCTEVRASYDKGRVIRYLNLAYHPDIFLSSLENWMRDHKHLVTITHPYELMPCDVDHGLLSFAFNVLEENILAIEQLSNVSGVAVEFLTLSEMAGIFAQRYMYMQEADPSMEPS